MCNRIMEQGIVQDNKCLAKGYNYITISSPKIAMLTKPGQFVFIRCTEGTDPFLRRPISICSVDPENGMIGLLVKVIGRGTEIISEYKIGNKVDMMGPIGTDFPIYDNSKSLIIAGGIGIAPLSLLMSTLHDRKEKVNLVYGVQTKEQLFLLEQLQKNGKVIVVTEDGSAGEQGLITKYVTKELESGEYTHVYVCGPKGMLVEVQKTVSNYEIEGFVSLEERLACGIGACSGCTVPIQKGDGNYTYKKVCVDGPVFPFEEVIFDEC